MVSMFTYAVFSVLDLNPGMFSHLVCFSNSGETQHSHETKPKDKSSSAAEVPGGDEGFMLVLPQSKGLCWFAVAW